jgi:hypothetical protein
MTEEKLIDLARVGMGIHSPNDPEYIVCEALIKALARRTWVGLTPDELNAIFDGMKTWSSFQITDVYFAIEAKLKEKNT